VTPPKSSIAAVWSVEGFGEGKGSGGKNAPIHFGDTTPAAPDLSDNESKLAPKSPSKTVAKKVSGGSNGKSKSAATATAGKNGARNAPARNAVKPAATPHWKRR
jgi:hypothetical protein